MSPESADPKRLDYLIIGAGVIGSSLAMHLSRDSSLKICVIDLDMEGTFSSSELNAGGVRATWFHPLNVALARDTIDYLSKISKEVGYRDCGYLWLYTEEKFQKVIDAHKPNLDPQWPLKILDPAAIQNQVPFLDKLDSVAGATFTPRDGLVNPNLLKKHYRAMARERGVEFKDRSLLRRLVSAPDSQGAVEVEVEVFDDGLSSEARAKILEGATDIKSKKLKLKASRVINCAGPWAQTVSKILGYSCPSKPVRRQVCIFESREVDLTPYGMMVDTSGVYFHPEAHQGLAGFAEPKEPEGYNFNYDGEGFFQDVIWPALYERSTGFERLKHITGWAGLYEVSPDESAIVGECSGDWRGRGKVFEAHSFSGHGVMQSYSIGKELAEFLRTGKYAEIDASHLSSARFETGKLIHETLVI